MVEGDPPALCPLSGGAVAERGVFLLDGVRRLGQEQWWSESPSPVPLPGGRGDLVRTVLLGSYTIMLHFARPNQRRLLPLEGELAGGLRGCFFLIARKKGL